MARWLLLASLYAAASASDFAGASACRPCHEKQHRTQSASGHARTLHRVPQHPLADRFAPAARLVRPPGFEFSFERSEQDYRVKIRERAAEGAELEIPLDWAFGSGAHGVTFVSRTGTATYLEHAFTFYAGANVFDLTPGHRRLPARTLMEAAGQTFPPRGPDSAIRACFGCHSTGPTSISPGREIAVTEAGVRCEACHGPGRAHIQSASRSSIRNPKSLPAEEVLRFCGACHRPPDGHEAANDFTNPWNVRHQPPYLEQSKCFRGSAGALSCFTCHAPHENLRRRDAAYYRDRCLLCHAGGPERPRPALVCQTEPEPDCVGCHMPAVAADPRLQFRNHWIGVYRSGASLIPSR